MAENEPGGTEQSTAKRRERAREAGQVPRSRDLSSAAVLFCSAIALKLLGPYSGGQLRGLLGSGLALPRADALDESRALEAIGSAAAHGFSACAPLCAVSLAAAIAAPLAVGGWNFTLKALAPDLTRLNPLTGLTRMFSARGAAELLKAFLKFLLIAVVGATVLWHDAPAIAALSSAAPETALARCATQIADAFLMLAGAVALIAAIDVPWQLWQHARRLRMTRAEVREEMKESEGAPETKGRIRNIQRELARRRMMADVRKADVVVVNPTHYAVALRYVEARMRAPVVVAKGLDLVAARIRAVAEEHRIPIFEAPPLARALHRHVEIGAEIPASLYVAVAQVLTYLSQLRSAARYGHASPPLPVLELEPGAQA
ncbi:MAG TPA: flagellar biosynthesis protein FlhB [Steroidobacteraceae bacterium]|nr:flagellar biosynthesis protein FlhB [Steroidobacteraceae bacterium]